jgi:hypothetical protein
MNGERAAGDARALARAKPVKLNVEQEQGSTSLSCARRGGAVVHEDSRLRVEGRLHNVSTTRVESRGFERMLVNDRELLTS